MAPSSKSQPVITAVVPETKLSFGFTDYSERLNGRFAMIGFVAMFLVEYSTHQTLVALAGIG